jgi:hypothetical protein
MGLLFSTIFIAIKRHTMKTKLILLCFIIVGLTSSTVAQVANYIFTETTGTYTAITGGVQLATTTAGVTSYDTDGNYFTITSSSQFTFNGTTITSVNMTADGALWLNPLSSTTGNGVTGPIASSASAVGVISPMGMDLRSTSLATQVYERRWQDVGTEVVFQWKNCARYLTDATERFSFQIRITKSTGVIKFVYGNMTTIANSTSYQPYVGLRGSTNTDFVNRRLTGSVPDATPNWGAPNGTTAGTTNGHTCRFTSGATCYPVSGLTFIWTPTPPPTPPSNDNSSGAITLTVNSTDICTTTTDGTTINATQSSAAQSLYGTADDDVWYKFVATSQDLTMIASLTTIGDLVVEAYTNSLVSIGVVDSYFGTETVDFTNLTVGSNYYVRIYSYGSTVANRGTFNLCIKTPPNPLPIELILFNGSSEGNYNHITWSTASESNNDYFTVEKTIDGKSFTVVGIVGGAGNSTVRNDYTLDDNNISQVINYYRLKQTDYDGLFKYSELISINNLKLSGKVLIKVFNLMGQEVIYNYNGILIFYYSDGSIEKKYFN